MSCHVVDDAQPQSDRSALGPGSMEIEEGGPQNLPL